MLQMTDAMGLQGMINDLVQQSDFPTGDKLTNELDQLELKNPTALARIISAAENFPDVAAKLWRLSKKRIKAANSSIGNYGNWWLRKIISVDELVRRFLIDFPEKPSD
jgi:methylmalonyl-CoA mutase